MPTIALIATAVAGRGRHCPMLGLTGVLMGGIVVWLLVIGFVAPAFQLGYLMLGPAIPSLGLLGLRAAQ